MEKFDVNDNSFSARIARIEERARAMEFRLNRIEILIYGVLGTAVINFLFTILTDRITLKGTP
jgi:hypothetical protein